MAKNLVLVESPSKAKTINKYLGRSYQVESTVGHLRNLPKTKLGIDIEDGFKPNLLNIRGKGDLIKKIRKLASKASNIYIATDPDREGEAIAQDVIDILDNKTDANVYRVLFNEITKTAVKNSMQSTEKVNTNLVISQRARRVMDRIIGYKISPFLWRALIEESGNSLSAGRVQSIALRLICEREAEIDAFIQTEYWSLYAILETDKGETIKAKLYSVEGRQLKIQPKPEMTKEDWDEFLKGNFAINNADLAKEIFERIKSKEKFVISDISRKEVKRNPYPPFITSSLQAEASKQLKFRPRKTMQVAQSLYEGVDLGKDEGYVGLITYMRTDSTRLNKEILYDALNYIENKFGKEFSANEPKTFEGKKKNVQDAHEAIRPTSVVYTPERVKPHLSKEQYNLYELIWKRFIASQMQPAITETTTVEISADEFIFKSSGTVIKFNGFLSLYDEYKEDTNNDENGELLLPAGLKVDQDLKHINTDKKQHFTKPPARFSESTLIKALEANGVGRPSTYAGIMSTILDRQYVDTVGRNLAPTNLGKKVNNILVKNFPEIFEVSFTAQMEGELDLIANGEIEYEKVLNDFYGPFAIALEHVEKNIEKIKCEKCGSDMDIKIGRFGKFLACTNYPECKNIKSLKEMSQENDEPEYTGEKCPECGSKTIFRHGKFGRFIGCEKYPDCNYTKQITLGLKCPKCKEGEIVTKRTKRGRFFYGCNRYPDCDFASWTKPKAEAEEDN
ncbi:MAG: type I DNA topoisomerase [Melioribacteraceae bacterium]|nr:type I DNA topoisomerase [Melioribacteraceae bacterium]MCF8352913.1 type I DNA topoisomerase [Melioribacteraceae bacterium]MCF8395254.1 type I DNA topoisomerase [Melioribacteraceae bacterium]MCF8417430.1 type I DNA topoisomerase [Melioribacteraceae bacterium]